MAKKKSSKRAGKPNTNQQANAMEIEKQKAAAKAEKENLKQRRTYSNHRGTQQQRQPLSALHPNPTTLRSNKLVRPKAPVAVTKDLDPLSAADARYFLVDERHKDGDLRVIPNPVQPIEVNIPHYVGKPYFRLVELPNEIMDSILQHVIPKERYHLKWLGNHQRYKSLTYELPDSSDRKPLLESDVLIHRKILRNPRSEVRNVLISDIHTQISPVSLLWVCRGLYEPASRMFYAKTTFQFSGLRTLRHFLDRMKPDRKQLIQRFRLDYRPYGHPAKVDHKVWKEKADKAWRDLCWRVRKECSNLTFLNLLMTMNKEPIDFCPLNVHFIDLRFKHEWLRPLLAFKEAKETDDSTANEGIEFTTIQPKDSFKLERLILQVTSQLKVDTVLEVESQHLRKEILGSAWDDKRERLRDAFGYWKKKKKVVKIGRAPTMNLCNHVTITNH